MLTLTPETIPASCGAFSPLACPFGWAFCRRERCRRNACCSPDDVDCTTSTPTSCSNGALYFDTLKACIPRLFRSTGIHVVSRGTHTY